MNDYIFQKAFAILSGKNLSQKFFQFEEAIDCL